MLAYGREMKTSIVINLAILEYINCATTGRIRLYLVRIGKEMTPNFHLCPLLITFARRGRRGVSHIYATKYYPRPFQFRIITQSRRIPAVACIKLTPQKHRYNAKVHALTEGISSI